MSVVFCFSNQSHFAASLPLIRALRAFSPDMHIFAIADLADSHYAAGLGAILEQNKYLFTDCLVFPSSLNMGIFSKLKGFLTTKKRIACFLKKACAQQVFAFTEGGRIEWLVLGLARRAQAQTYCIQWAITWKPEIYRRLRADRDLIKVVFLRLFMKLLGADFLRMKYLGDGGADVLLTLGDYFTRQFEGVHPTHVGKFKSFGQSSFVSLLDLREKPKRNVAVLTTGAGTFLYSSSRDNHLADIRDIYEAFSLARAQGSETILLHRPHPRDVCLDDIKLLAEGYDGVEVTARPLAEILDGARYLVTIRSTSGFEALISGVPVFIYQSGRIDIPFNFADEGLADAARDVSGLSALMLQKEPFLAPLEKVEEYVRVTNVLEEFVALCNNNSYGREEA